MEHLFIFQHCSGIRIKHHIVFHCSLRRKEIHLHINLYILELANKTTWRNSNAFKK